MFSTKSLLPDTNTVELVFKTLDVPVAVPKTECDTMEGRILSVSLDVKKQVTCAPIERDDGPTQIALQESLDHPCKNKLFRVKSDAERINDRRFLSWRPREISGEKRAR